MNLKDPPTCEVCNTRPSVGVCAVPGVPCSCAYCQTCLDANAHPWGIVVANTACVGGLEHAAPWWKDIVADTCKHLGKTMVEFSEAVEKSMAIDDAGPG